MGSFKASFLVVFCLVASTSSVFAAEAIARNAKTGWKTKVISGSQAIQKIQQRLPKSFYEGIAYKSTYVTHPCRVKVTADPQEAGRVEISYPQRRTSFVFSISPNDRVVYQTRVVGGIQEALEIQEGGQTVESLFINTSEGSTEAANVTIEKPFGQSTREKHCMF